MFKPLIACALLISFARASFGQTLYIPEIANVLTPDGSGAYSKLINEVVSQSSIDVSIEYLPLARAIKVFTLDKDACFFPASAQTARDYTGLEYIDASEAMNYLLILFAYQKGVSLEQPLVKLKGKDIAALLGDDIEVFGMPASDYRVTYVNNHDQSVAMLQSDRVSAILGSASDLLPYADNLFIDYTHPLYTQKETITCHSNQNKQALLDTFDQTIRRMKKTGQIKQILGEHYNLDRVSLDRLVPDR